MGVGNLFKFSKPLVEVKETSGASTPARSDSSLEKDGYLLDDSPVRYLTFRTFILGLIVSMGGTVFGYSTGMSSAEYTAECFGI